MYLLEEGIAGCLRTTQLNSLYTGFSQWSEPIRDAVPAEIRNAIENRSYDSLARMKAPNEIRVNPEVEAEETFHV
jgi:hypothetical protein